MRLLHTKELRFQEFFDADIPKYAILSHRWGEDEVSYQDFLTGAKRGGAGFRKIVAACAYAAKDVGTVDNLGPWKYLSLNWIWIDTCCINKENSSELSEAINSMYRWYARSQVCYVYLSDVLENLVPEGGDSEWFTRGWTLQELLAPGEVIFFSKQWQELGRRNDDVTFLAGVTGISSSQLTQFCKLRGANITAAEKLSWAANRSTTRKEDQAYCLLGLFDVSMPLLYGEGDNAFQRLQRKILKSSNDESIFLWDQEPYYADLYPHSGMLAKRIASVGESRYIEQHLSISIKHPTPRPPYSVTNQGLQFHIPADLASKPEILLPLNCNLVSHNGVVRAYAVRLVNSGDGGTWLRSFQRRLSDCLPPLTGAVSRVPGSFGLFLVPEDWVWSREQLSKRGSEIIYVRLW